MATVDFSKKLNYAFLSFALLCWGGLPVVSEQIESSTFRGFKVNEKISLCLKVFEIFSNGMK
jgi:hypothetical protein